MNTLTTTAGNAQEYRTTMQEAALHFLQRHQGEHLADDGHLFDRAVSYLVNALDVPTFMADRLVYLAMSDLYGKHKPAPIGIDYGTGDSATVALLRFSTGEKVLIPCRHLPLRLQPPTAQPAAAAAN
ncbi:hypothetical protein [Stutzerimonas stutzeri]|uniref:Uncharacterized protein n=1 Tax=Stutzerimonas stutzeri TaxID=316 RepID=A0A0D9APB4_STUST|nr:hypothetical protein [Stutzerimonas stutzeri]KJH82865.1 hypothetical protein UF78_08490 [Stutzerimonas stutzeri]